MSIKKILATLLGFSQESNSDVDNTPESAEHIKQETPDKENPVDLANKAIRRQLSQLPVEQLPNVKQKLSQPTAEELPNVKRQIDCLRMELLDRLTRHKRYTDNRLSNLEIRLSNLEKRIQVLEQQYPLLKMKSDMLSSFDGGIYKSAPTSAAQKFPFNKLVPKNPNNISSVPQHQAPLHPHHFDSYEK